MKKLVVFLTRLDGSVASIVLPGFVQKKIFTLPYYKLSSHSLKFLLFVFFDTLLSRWRKGSVHVFREDFLIDGKVVKVKFDLDLTRYVDRRLYFFDDNWELMKLMKKVLSKKDLYLDIGANIGQTALLAAKFAKKVIAFEPVPEVQERFKKNLKSSGLKNVELKKYAVSDKVSSTKIHVSSMNDGANSLNKDFRKTSRNTYDDTVSITTKPLDNLKLKNVALAKIDVEGHELSVIKGMSKTIKEMGVVVCETTPEYYEEVVDNFLKSGFFHVKEFDGGYKKGIMNLLFVNKKKVCDLDNFLRGLGYSLD